MHSKGPHPLTLLSAQCSGWTQEGLPALSLPVGLTSAEHGQEQERKEGSKSEQYVVAPFLQADNFAKTTAPAGSPLGLQALRSTRVS